MNIGTEGFRQHFELLSDEALLATKPEDLVEAAQECLEAELLSRGLIEPAAEEPSEGEETVEQNAPEAEAAGSHELTAGEELVVIATYTVADDASLARGLLESASIPARLENENLGLGAFQLRLLVPASFEQDALEILDYEISEEDLAAQAEAAGDFEDEEVDGDGGSNAETEEETED